MVKVVKAKQVQQGSALKTSTPPGSCKFKPETWATIAKFTPGTLIKYGPNPKRPDSKSFVRYAAYMKAKTVAEALRLGAKKADLFWELERGDCKVVGGQRPDAAEVAAIGQKWFEYAQQILASTRGPRELEALQNEKVGAADEDTVETTKAQRTQQSAKAKDQKSAKTEDAQDSEAQAQPGAATKVQQNATKKARQSIKGRSQQSAKVKIQQAAKGKFQQSAKLKGQQTAKLAVQQSAKLKPTRRTGHVSQKSERGSGMKFKLETFAAVAQFTPGTLIKYGPNRKRPESKSYTRYDGYMGAKTVGEALKFGAKKADLFWELERGDYKVLGGERAEKDEVAAIGRDWFDKVKEILATSNGPNGLAFKVDDPRAMEQLQKEETWRAAKVTKCEALAIELGLPVETQAEVDACGESSDVRLERRVADALAEKKLTSGKKITAADVSEILHLWGFCQNVGRLNVMQEGQKYVYSDTIGAIRQRTGGVSITPPTRRYPNFPKLLFQFLVDNKPKLKSKFVCTAININANYAGRRHRDQNNEGPSVIRAFGKFTGGKLHYWPKDMKKAGRPAVETLDWKDSVSFDLAKENLVFDGNRAHEVEPFEGERYSIVFFTARGFAKTSAEDVQYLKKVGFPWPTAQSLRDLKEETGTV